MSNLCDRSIRLPDGRSLGYSEYGDPDGTPVLHFHGFPSSRYEGHRAVMEAAALKLRARVFVLERPGFGLSEFAPERKITDWPQDVCEFAHQQGINRFAILGHSGGGPYVAACAWKIPEQVSGAAIISGVSPLAPPEAYRGMNASDRQSYQLACHAPGLLRLIYGWVGRSLRSNSARFLAGYARELSQPDQAALAEPDIMAMTGRMAAEAFRAGSKGVTWDTVLLTRAWGFRPEDIAIPVAIWHGEADNVVPIAHGRFMANRIPKSESHFLPNEGHISLIHHHFEEILTALVS